MNMLLTHTSCNHFQPLPMADAGQETSGVTELSAVVADTDIR